ncbi:hypothetical protein [Vibrio quintilis]|uniref:Uncharacterized protein n=1 Tax=Vibrio quintilis TaxID=1117707 RepID=A0A1M7YW23_9VIBR|nr:hypothetical protein [Vibrio quintilis]SHO56847.1 hypothetical protein VQ7734_02616 [Vibrio quintilis]
MERTTKPNQSQETTEDLLDQVTQQTTLSEPPLDTTCTYMAVIADIDEENQLWLNLPQLEYLINAYSCVPVCNNDIGRHCVIGFIEHDFSQPVVTGLLHQPNAPELHLKATQKVVLECGKSKIELDEHGRVYIRGRSVSSQSYGTNRIKGGSVKLN